MKKLSLHLAAVNAAGSAVGKTPKEIESIKKDVFNASGLQSKQDYDMFCYLFDDAHGQCESYAKQLLPSEAAAVQANINPATSQTTAPAA